MAGDRAFKRLAFRGIALMLGVVLCDVTLTVCAALWPWLNFQLEPPWSRGAVPDQVLGTRNSPYYPGHDRLGYRNERVPEHCDYLCVGDSLTYGYAATATNSWPRQLQAMLGTTVYNAGVGGYGPCEYNVVVDELVFLKPKVVLLGLFLGNDLRNAHDSVYATRRFAELGDPQAIPSNRGDSAPMDPVQLPDGDTSSGGWKNVSSLYRLGRSLRWSMGFREDQPFRLVDDAESEISHRSSLLFDHPQFKTWFLPKGGEGAVNLEDPKIHEGLRIAQDRIRHMASSLTRADVQFVVVLLPTKEAVYAALIAKDHPELLEQLETRILRESRVRAAMVAFLQEQGLHYVDTLQPLSESFANNVAPYPSSDDIHPNGNGYKVIAETVRAKLARLQVTDHAAPVTAQPSLLE